MPRGCGSVGGEHAGEVSYATGVTCGSGVPFLRGWRHSGDRNDVTSWRSGGLLQNRGVSGCGVCPGLTVSVHGEELPSGGPGSAVSASCGYAGMAAGGSSGAPGDRCGGGAPGYVGVPCRAEDGGCGGGGL